MHSDDMRVLNANELEILSELGESFSMTSRYSKVLLIYMLIEFLSF